MYCALNEPMADSTRDAQLFYVPLVFWRRVMDTVASASGRFSSNVNQVDRGRNEPLCKMALQHLSILILY